MTDATRADDFVAHYARLLPDSDSSELQKILEMKALRRADQTPLIQRYKARFEQAAGAVVGAQASPSPAQPSSSNTGPTTGGGGVVSAAAPPPTLPTALSAVVSAAADGWFADAIGAGGAGGDSSMRRLERLVKRRF